MAFTSRADEFDLYLDTGVYTIVYISLTTYCIAAKVYNKVTGQGLVCIHVLPRR